MLIAVCSTDIGAGDVYPSRFVYLMRSGAVLCIFFGVSIVPDRCFSEMAVDLDE